MHSNTNSIPENSQLEAISYQQKEILKEEAAFPPSVQKGWYRHMSDCIASEMCPCCGDYIFVNEEIATKAFRKNYFFGCSSCDWRSDRDDKQINIPFETARVAADLFHKGKL